MPIEPPSEYAKQVAAFPIQEGFLAGGMRMRDFLAAAALQGLLAEPYHDGVVSLANAVTKGLKCDGIAERCARAAYIIADAMLVVRDK